MPIETCKTRLVRRAGAVGLTSLLLALAGCGGGGHDDNNNGVATGNNPAQADSYIALVSDVLGTSSETTEPVATDNFAVTSPEQLEPTPLT